MYVYPHSDESHFCSPTWRLCCRFLEFEYDAPLVFISKCSSVGSSNILSIFSVH